MQISYGMRRLRNAQDPPDLFWANRFSARTTCYSTWRKSSWAGLPLVDHTSRTESKAKSTIKTKMETKKNTTTKKKKNKTPKVNKKKQDEWHFCNEQGIRRRLVTMRRPKGQQKNATRQPNKKSCFSLFFRHPFRVPKNLRIIFRRRTKKNWTDEWKMGQKSRTRKSENPIFPVLFDESKRKS